VISGNVRFLTDDYSISSAIEETKKKWIKKYINSKAYMLEKIIL